MSNNLVLNELKVHRERLSSLVGENMQQNLDAGLMTLALNQTIISSGDPTCIPARNELPSKDAVRSYCLAMIVEMAEFVQELDWKPWKDKSMNRERIADEFADILAFMGVLIVYMDRMGISSSDIAEQYIKKSVKNLDRFIGQLEELDKPKNQWIQTEIPELKWRRGQI